MGRVGVAAMCLALVVAARVSAPVRRAAAEAALPGRIRRPARDDVQAARGSDPEGDGRGPQRRPQAEAASDRRPQIRPGGRRSSAARSRRSQGSRGPRPTSPSSRSGSSTWTGRRTTCRKSPTQLRRAHDQGAAPDRPLHPQRQPRQQRHPRLRLRLLQLQVLEVRMMMNRRGAWLWPGRPRAALCLLSVQAGAERAQQRQPDRLARRRDQPARCCPATSPAPVAVHLAGGVRTTDGSPIPRVNWIKLELAWRGRLNTHGLPGLSRRCGCAAPTAGQAMEACGGSLVGRGGLYARDLRPRPGAVRRPGQPARLQRQDQRRHAARFSSTPTPPTRRSPS